MPSDDELLAELYESTGLSAPSRSLAGGAAKW